MADTRSLSITDKVAIFALIATVVFGALPLNTLLRCLLLLAALVAALYLCWHAQSARWKKWAVGVLLTAVYVAIVFWLLDREAREANSVAPTTNLLKVCANAFWDIPWRWVLPALAGFTLAILLAAIRWLYLHWERQSSGSRTTVARAKRARLRGSGSAEANCNYEWLHKIAESDKKAIEERARVCAILYLSPPLATAERLQEYIEFTFFIFNLSLYDIVFSDSLGGCITFGSTNERFTRACKMANDKAVVCHARDNCTLTVRQYLDPTEAKNIARIDNVLFWFKALGVTFRRVGSSPLQMVGGSSLRRVGGSSDESPVLLNTDYCLQTKQGRWHVNDYPEYAFALNDEQWADLTRGDLVRKRAEITELQLEINSLTSKLANAVQVPIHGQLLIEMAVYGAGEDVEPVTSILQSMVRDGQLKIEGKYNTIFRTHPARGLHKELKIDYLHNGQKFSVTVPENAELVLPVPYKKDG